jgi:hypothetical protein
VTQLLLECYFAGTPAASRAPSPAPHITHPLPLYFAGDSAVLAFRHGLFTLPEFDRPFLGCALHVPSLRASELSDECGRLNASLVEQLLSISILMRDDKSSFRVTNYDRISRTGAERLAFDPPLLLFCGANDVSVLLQELGQRSVAVPPEASGGRACEARPDDWPFEDAKAVALGLFERFECGLRILQSFGFRDLAVHSVVAAPDIAEHVHAATMVVNAAIAEICARAGVIYVEICPQAGGRNGVRDEPAMLSVRRLIDMMEARAADGNAGLPEVDGGERCRESSRSEPARPRQVLALPGRQDRVRRELFRATHRGAVTAVRTHIFRRRSVGRSVFGALRKRL